MSPLPEKKLSSQTGSMKWEGTFPADIHIEKSSSVLVHRLIKCATSFILDKRQLLEEKCFRTRTIDKLLIPTFDKSYAKAERLVKKMDSLKESIEKKYLRQFALVFYKKPNEEDIVEVFAFRLMYGEEDEIVLSVDSGDCFKDLNQNFVNASFTNLNETQKHFIDTFKKLCKCFRRLGSLPEGCDASFRISFTEAAPNDYMPEGFDESPTFYDIGSNFKSTQMGIICGGFHQLQIAAASTLMKNDTDFDETINSMNLSIIAKDLPSSVKSKKGAEKKIARKDKRAPYGKSETLNKRNSVSQESV